MLRNKLTPKSLAWGGDRQPLRKTEPQEAPGPHFCWNPLSTEELEERKTQHAGETKTSETCPGKFLDRSCVYMG